MNSSSLKKSFLDHWVAIMGVLGSLLAVIGMTVGFLAWADSEFLTKEEAQREQVKSQLIHDKQAATQKLDYFSSREEVLRLELRYLLSIPDDQINSVDRIRIEELKSTLPFYREQQQQAREALR